jgi:hypothetical protein
MRSTRTIRLAAALVGCCALLLFACNTSGEPAEGTRVTTESPEFKAVTQAIQESCNEPAEFGRCGCFMDSVKTSCAIVKACLNAGFCTVGGD